MSADIEWTKKYTNEWALKKQFELDHRDGILEGSLEEKIFQVIRLREGTTFVELEQYLGDDIIGKMALSLKDYPNVILWNTVSSEFCNAINKMLEEKTIVFKPTPQLTYMVDGKCIKMPLATRLMQYKTPRWLPVAFYSYMFKEPQRRR